MFMIPAEDPKMVDFFKGQIAEDPTLKSAATLSAKKLRILRDPKMSSAEKKSLVKELNPRIHSLIKKLRQLPAGVSSSAELDEDQLKEEEEDLVTPVQQKLLQRILRGVTPKKEKKFFEGIKREAEQEETPKRGKKQRIKRKTLQSELPFYEEGPPLDLERAVERTLRRERKRVTPRAVRELRPARGWESWEPRGDKTRKKLSFTTPRR